MKKLLIVAFICLFASNAFAESKGFQASLVPEVAIHSRTTRIEGVTLNIWGENPQSAFALGFVNGSTGDSMGFSWGTVNYAEKYAGVELALLNYASSDFKGLQSGIFNYAGKLTGLQLGTVNFAKKADSGVQIGLINIIAQNKWFSEFPSGLAPGMIFVNWRF